MFAETEAGLLAKETIAEAYNEAKNEGGMKIVVRSNLNGKDNTLLMGQA
jgi:hypothetical protein